MQYKSAERWSPCRFCVIMMVRTMDNELPKKVYNMKIKVMDNARDIREAFKKRFVMSWEEFQVKQKDWIADRKKTAIQSNALGVSNLTCGTK